MVWSLAGRLDDGQHESATLEARRTATQTQSATGAAGTVELSAVTVPFASSEDDRNLQTVSMHIHYYNSPVCPTSILVSMIANRKVSLSTITYSISLEERCGVGGGVG